MQIKFPTPRLKPDRRPDIWPRSLPFPLQFNWDEVPLGAPSAATFYDIYLEVDGAPVFPVFQNQYSTQKWNCVVDNYSDPSEVTFLWANQ
jgi:hypothetical protein